MYIQLKLKSFYKINNAQKTNKSDFKNYFSCYKIHRLPAVTFIFYLLVLKLSKNRPINELNTMLKTKLYADFHVSLFALPVFKKTTIFLRAPYKNKLARLNILRLERSVIISIKNNNIKAITNRQDLFFFFKATPLYTLSTYKFAHTKTTFILDVFTPANFIFKIYQ